MILPTKHLPTEQSLVSVGAVILSRLDESKTVSRIWDEVTSKAQSDDTRSHLTFDWFILALDFLYAINAIEITRGRIHKVGSL